MEMKTIPKEEAERIMTEAGYECTLVNGILQFKGTVGRRAAQAIKRKLKEIGYSASYAYEIRTEEKQ